MTDVIVGVIMLLAIGGLIVILVRWDNRKHQDVYEAAVAARTALEAGRRASEPMPIDMEILLDHFDTMERKNAARFESLKARILWTPLLWMVVCSVLWVLGYGVIHS